MIADIHKRESFSTIVNYANNQKKARLIDSRGVDITNNATIATDMQWQSDQRKILGKRLVSEPVYHISLDFALEDRPKLNDDLLRQIAREYMQRMGIKDTQYIVCRHLDTDHVHLHIVANRVDDNFGCISDARDLERNVRVCKALTREYGLTLGKDKQKVKRSHLRGRDAAKYRIYDAIQSVLTPGMGWKDFCRSLKECGIEVRFNVNQKTGQIVGVSFGQGHYNFAGSKIDVFTSFRHLDNFLSGGLGGGQGVGGSGRSGGQTAETPVSGESDIQPFQAPTNTPMDLFAEANGTSDTDNGGTGGGDIFSVAADVIMEMAFQPHYAPAVGGGGSTGSDLKWRDDDREKNKHNTNHIRRSGRR